MNAEEICIQSKCPNCAAEKFPEHDTCCSCEFESEGKNLNPANVYAIASLCFDLIALIIVLLYLTILPLIFIATPFAVVGIICGVGGNRSRKSHALSILGIVGGIILFAISIWFILYVIAIFGLILLVIAAEAS